MDRPAARLIAATALFVALTLLFTYPVWTAPDRLLNDMFDARLTAWIMAWDAHALVDPTARLFDANIFHPYSRTLAYSENLLGSALLVAPLNWAGEPILAHNLLFLGSFVLSGMAMLLWVRRLGGGWIGGTVAGVVWAFAPTKTDHLAHIQLLTSMWVPLALWVLTIYVQERRRGLLVVAAGLLGWQYWTGIQAALVTFPFVGLFFIAAWYHRPTPRPGELRRLLREAVPATVLLLVMVVPLSIPYLQVSEAHAFTRTLEEIRLFSAQPTSFLAGSWANRAPHMAALHRLLGKSEGNHGLGIIGSLLLAAGVVLAMRELGIDGSHRRSTEGDGARPVRPGTGNRRHMKSAVFSGAAGLTVIATTLHLGGVLAASVSPQAGSVGDIVIAACQWTHPALWMVVGSTLLLFSWEPATEAARAKNLIQLLWLAGLAYLLSLGAEVQQAGTTLGVAPFAALHEWALPYRSMRSVGRFGIAWLLFAAPAIGVATRRLVERASRASGRPWLRTALLALVLAGLVWEFRTWPMRAEDASIPEPEVYEALATLPTDGAVVHLPMRPLESPPRTTEYMLGSTLHWRQLVNGYSGFAPRDLDRLARTSPRDPEFWGLLHSRFPVDYVVVHGRWFQRSDYEEFVRMLRQERPELEAVRRTRDATIFAVGRYVERGRLIRRRFSEHQLRRSRALTFQVRGPDDDDAPVAAVVEVLWAGNRAATCPIASRWSRCTVPAPAEWTPRADGTGEIQLWRPPSPELRPVLGTTGVRLTTELLVDAQLQHLAIARDDHWEWARPSAGAVVTVLDLGGRQLLHTRQFEATDAGAAALLEFLEEVPDGRIVALAVHHVPATAPGSSRAKDIGTALRLVGATGTLPDGTWVHAVLGARGAPVGSALEEHAPRWATVRAGPARYPGDTIVVRDLQLVESAP